MSVDVRFVEQARRDLTALLTAHPELEEDEVLHIDMVEGLTDAMDLLDSLIIAEREAKGLAEGLDAVISRLELRAQRFANRQHLLRKYIMQLMEAANLKKAERPAATVSIASGRPKVVVFDETALPNAFFRVKREPSMGLISDALKRNEDVPGATLSNAEPVLRIS